jgi:hypothetical protein
MKSNAFASLGMAGAALLLSTATPALSQQASAEVQRNPLNDAYFGNLHIHTNYSFDGYTNGALTNPADAYRWAQGEPIPGGGGGGDLQIKVPLDWYAVSDHAEYLGVFRKMEDPESPFSKLAIAKRVTSDDAAEAFEAYSQVLAEMSAGKSDPALSDPAISRSIWAEVVQMANDAYKPGSFTTFPAFEWTSNPNERNLHRVVLFETNAGIPDLPFSAIDSDKPEDLWAWMDAQRDAGATLLAVPHNGNASDGLMFSKDGKDSFGNPIDMAYSETRMRNEPLYEATQIKGTSDTHPDLSPNDEFANFELWDYTLAASAERPKNRVGSYSREAYRHGLVLAAGGQGNPFRFGLIGDSDTHNSAAVIEEDNYTGKFAFENDAEHRLEGPPGFDERNALQVREFGSGGVAGVWAEANTREDIYAGLANKETFATSGPRLKVRMFAGYGFAPDILKSDEWVAQAYATGVPMGGDLPPNEGSAPSIIVAAIKEADGANLDRIQIIKGWIDSNGTTHERIFNVAMSAGRITDAEGNVPDVGNTVDAAKASYSNNIGAVELGAVWTDPDFDPAQPAFYYSRVLQIPTPRWSTYDAMKLGIEPRTDVPVWIRERAWSSPIWYVPEE